MHCRYDECSYCYLFSLYVIQFHLQFLLLMLPSLHRTYCAKIGRGGGDNGDVGVRRWQIGGGYHQQRQRGTKESLPRQIG